MHGQRISLCRPDVPCVGQRKILLRLTWWKASAWVWKRFESMVFKDRFQLFTLALPWLNRNRYPFSEKWPWSMHLLLARFLASLGLERMDEWPWMIHDSQLAMILRHGLDGDALGPGMSLGSLPSLMLLSCNLDIFVVKMLIRILNYIKYIHIYIYIYYKCDLMIFNVQSVDAKMVFFSETLIEARSCLCCGVRRWGRRKKPYETIRRAIVNHNYPPGD